MEIDITIRNYRCFSDQHPVRMKWRPGFTAFVGPNNSGKSTLLRFFYEMRPLFANLAAGGPGLYNGLVGQPQPFRLPAAVVDPQEIFWNQGLRQAEIEFRLEPSLLNSPGSGPTVLQGAVIALSRDTNGWTGSLVLDGRAVAPTARGASGPGTDIVKVGTVDFNLAPLCEAFQLLSRGLYVGAFRNAINLGAKQDYFDIAVGQAFIKSWRDYKTGPVKRNSEAALRVQDDVKRIFGFDSLEINTSNDDMARQ